MDAEIPQPDQDSQLLTSFSRKLQQAAHGDADARRDLWSENYELFQTCAAQWFQRAWNQRGDDHRISLCANDIVDEVFCRLVDRTAAMANGRQYFFRAFYNECLRVAVDHYRKSQKHKIGRVDLDSSFLVDEQIETNLDLLAETIDKLEQHDARIGQIARMRVFDHRPDPKHPGAVRALTSAEIGKIVGIAPRTVEQDWKFAKSYLLRRIRSEA